MIAKMKKARIVCFKEDIDNVLKQIQASSCLMITKQETSANRSLSVEAMIQRTTNNLKVINKYIKKKPLIKEYKEVSFDDLDKVKLSTDLNLQVETLVTNRTNYLQENKNLKEEIKNLSIWETLPVKLNDLHDTVYTKTYLGFIETKKLDALKEVLDNLNITYNLLGEVRNVTAIYLVAFINENEKVVDALKEASFSNVTLPNKDMDVVTYISSLNDLIKSNEEEIAKIEKDLTVLTEKVDELELYVDHLLTVEERNNVDYLETQEVYVIDGYLEAAKEQVLKSALEKATPNFDIEFTTPEDGEDVPTCAVNNKFVSPFESVTNMFSVPSTKEIDPNPVMSIWYWVLFGMMMGDVGYGAVLFIGSLLFIKIMHPKKGTLDLAKILFYSSIATILWGIFFNSYFGASLPFYKAVVSPMEDPINMLILSIAIGALHLITGLVMKIIKDVKAKEYQEMLGKDLSWILVIIGIGLIACSMKFPIPMMVGVITSLVGVALVLLFAGHQNKNIIKRGLFGLVGLYDATSFLGDILSYSRIMALVMSSASVAFVMNTLAGMVQGSVIGYIASVLIYIVGHIFNLVLGLLSAYVHDCRLQYIEFYGKFYDGGGKLFTPLSPKAKYTNEIK